MRSADEHGLEAGRLYDELLVTLVQAGDRQATARLAARWQPRLARTARRLLLDDELAKGVVQDAWVSILRGLSSLREPSRFAPWAFGILRRRCADAIRKLQHDRRIDIDDDAEVSANDEIEDGISIRQALTLLPPGQRLAAQLFFVEGLSLDEIAEVQDVPLGTAKTRLFHARRKLKAVLSNDPQGDDT